MKNRVVSLFEKKSKNILSVFYTAGFPSLNATKEIAEALQQGGVDMIELGIPFSDPVADGPTIQASNKIALDKQRHLINNFKLATELGAEIIKVSNKHIAKAIIEQCEQRSITTICIGKPHLSLMKIILATNVFNDLLKKLSYSEIDLVILS